MQQLDKILSALKKKYTVKLGVLGGNNSRQDTTTNAEIGITHEFGKATKNIPRRSFLLMPCHSQLNKRIKEIAPKVFKAVGEGKIETAYKVLGLLGESVVDGAFKTNGYGTWQPTSSQVYNRKLAKSRNRKNKKTPMTLVDTGQLRKSITSKVVNKV
jgi:phage gpG-like protein